MHSGMSGIVIFKDFGQAPITETLRLRLRKDFIKLRNHSITESYSNVQDCTKQEIEDENVRPTGR